MDQLKFHFMEETKIIDIFVVIQCYLWFKFYFTLFWGMVMYDNEFKTKENRFKSRIKLNHSIFDK